MGDYTDNNYFYKPDLGASGSTEKNKFDNALDDADEQIQDNKDKLAAGNVPMMTTAQIKEKTSSTTVLQVWNTDTDQLEIWVKGKRKPGR